MPRSRWFRFPRRPKVIRFTAPAGGAFEYVGPDAVRPHLEVRRCGFAVLDINGDPVVSDPRDEA